MQRRNPGPFRAFRPTVAAAVSNSAGLVDLQGYNREGPTREAKRTMIAWHHRHALFNHGRGKQGLPGAGTPVDSNYIRNMRFNPKSREQWDYNKIDETITKQSEFTSRAGREDFDNPAREIKFADMNSNQHMNTPKTGVRNLHEYFDQYTQPGDDASKKKMAAEAVQEFWDAENWYYPGETWKQNRPSFRSVPKEIINKETYYGNVDLFYKWEVICSSVRPRVNNPRWPPPGLNMGTYYLGESAWRNTYQPQADKNNFVPASGPEADRYLYYSNWNVELGKRWTFVNILSFVFLIYFCQEIWNLICFYMYYMPTYKWANKWYPGYWSMALEGEWKHEKDKFFWQEDLDNTYWFNDQSRVYYESEDAMRWIRWFDRQKELQAIAGTTA